MCHPLAPLCPSSHVSPSKGACRPIPPFPASTQKGQAEGPQLWGTTVGRGATVFNDHTARKGKTWAQGSREGEWGEVTVRASIWGAWGKRKRGRIRCRDAAGRRTHACPSAHPSVFPPTCTSIHPFIPSSTYLPTCLSTHPSIRLSIHSADTEGRARPASWHCMEDEVEDKTVSTPKKVAVYRSKEKPGTGG